MAEHAALIWLIAGVGLLLPGLFMMWLGLAALGTGVITLLGDARFAWQVVLFAALAALAIGGALRLRRRAGPRMLNTAESGLVGRSALAITGFEGGEGRVRVGDSDWAARLVAGEAPAPAGTRLVVRGVDGTVLRVGAAEITHA
jgi:membrane protein implicated in regulation of membrane protease activity